jgi:hypothetical protein
MKRGRKRKPDAIKRISGTLRKDRMQSDSSISITSTILPDPPDHLEGEGKVYYYEQGMQAIRLGILNPLNLPLFMSICFYVTETATCIRELNRAKDAQGRRVWRRMYDQGQQNLRLSMAEFGITPASVHKVGKPKEPESDFDSYLKNQNS